MLRITHFFDFSLRSFFDYEISSLIEGGTHGPMKAKSDSVTCFKHGKSRGETMFNETKIRYFQCECDGARELTKGAFEEYLASCGISFRPRTPQQNGVAERKHRHIEEMGHAGSLVVFGLKLSRLKSTSSLDFEKIPFLLHFHLRNLPFPSLPSQSLALQLYLKPFHLKTNLPFSVVAFYSLLG